MLPFWVRNHPALAYPHYVRLVLALGLSGLGSQFTVLALSLAVYAATGSVESLAGLWAVRVASRLVVQPFTGALVDRWDKRRVLFWGYLGSAALSASLALVAVAPLAVYPIVFVIQSVEGLVGPALLATIPGIVPKEALVSANALRVVVGRTASSLGPALAGLFYARMGPVWLFAFDALTFWVVSLVVRTLPPTLGPSSESKRSSLWADAWEGVRFALGRFPLVVVLLLAMLTSMFWRTVEIVMVPVSIEVAGMGPEGLGFLYTSLTLGEITSTAVLGGLAREVPGLSLVVLFNAVLGLPMLLASLFPSPPLLLGAFFVSGGLFSVASALLQSFLQASVSKSHLGRVFALVNVALALGVLPVLLAAPLVRWLGPLGVLAGVATLTLAGGAMLLVVLRLKRP